MNSLLERLRLRRLAPTFAILATLSAGIVIGSITAHGVKGKEDQVNSSDARPLEIPNPKVLSTQFSQIAKEVGPAVVNISTETLPKQSKTRTHIQRMPNVTPQSPDDDQGDQEDQGGGQGDPPGSRRRPELPGLLQPLLWRPGWRSG